MDHKEFDDIVGKKLGEEQNFPFDESQWDAVESRLEEKKKRRSVIWWYWGAAAAALLLLGISVNSIFLQKRINELENQVNDFKNESSISSPTLIQNSTAEINEKHVEVISPLPIKAQSKIVENKNSRPVTKNNLVQSTASNSSNQFSKQNDSKAVMIQKSTKSNLKPIVPIEKSIDQYKASNPIIVIKEENDDAQKEDLEKDESIAQKVISKSEEQIVDWTVFELLENKKEELISLDLKESFEPAKMKIKTKFGVKNFSTGLGGQFGWGVRNVTSSRFGNLRDVETVESFTTPQSHSASQSVHGKSTNFKWWSQLQFNKGLSLRTELGRKKISIQTPANSFPTNQSNSNSLDEYSGIFIAESTLVQSSSATIKQTEWILGAGVAYSPFRKWKVQPYVLAVPEFSWKADRKEDFNFDPNSSYDPNEKTGFDFNTNQFHLRNISARLGVQGVLWNHLTWHTELGMNLPVNAINPLLLNKYFVGLGVGYRFGN